MTLLSAFGGGLWVILLILLGAAGYSFYKAYKQRESGMRGRVQNPDGTWEWKESSEKLSYTEIGAFWFGVMFLCGFIAAVVLMAADK